MICPSKEMTQTSDFFVSKLDKGKGEGKEEKEEDRGGEEREGGKRENRAGSCS